MKEHINLFFFFKSKHPKQSLMKINNKEGIHDKPSGKFSKELRAIFKINLLKKHRNRVLPFTG